MSKRTGLGKGLGAFFGDDYDISQTKPRAPEAVNEEIRTGTPEEPADHADKKANLEEMDMVLPVAKKPQKKTEPAAKKTTKPVQKVKIVEVLPGDSSRLADEQSLLLMDILVKLEDGSYCNIEVQKIGYAFPGERAACYSADLLLRQYKTARSRRKEKFTYKDVKNVYTIVLIDKSSGDFHDFQEVYKHNFQQQSDTGLKMNLLQKYVFIPLDLFRSNVQNKGIKNKMDAWLAFLSMDDPDMIIQLITEYPEFKVMYQQAYEICRNVEALMGIFSEELRIMDRNTVKYMVDQMQEEIDSQKQEISIQKQQLKQKDILLSSKIQKIESLERELQRLKENQK